MREGWMAMGQAEVSAGPTSLQEQARLSGEFADWSNLVLGTAWLTGELDVGAVRDAWRHVCLSHDALRRTYVAEDEARTHADSLSEVEFHTAGTDAQAVELLRGILGVPFDLAGQGFSRIVVVRTGERRHLIGIALDHIITDEVSWLRMTTDFADFYGRSLRGAGIDVAGAGTYQGFASRQRREFDDAWGHTRKAFWQSYVAEFETVLPGFSVRRTPSATPARKVLTHDLPPDVSAKVGDFARRARVTPYAVAAASVLASMREVVDDPTVGLLTEGHGRVLPGTAQTLGLFVQGVPLHLTRKTTDPLETVQEVFGRSLDVFEFGLPPLVAGRYWQETLVAPGSTPGVHLYVYDGGGLTRMQPLAGTSVEAFHLEVPGEPRSWVDSVIVNCRLDGANPRFDAIYNEDVHPSDAVAQLLRTAAASLVP
ncbi:condensation domain-containing protein [Lentzea sp. JNUCC 0626]|uniref:condensation domain-containing protein n=1 Tax=Lentzea sp. JNUCC 0626 TaxID=3367513 RepID=UPI003749D0CD